MKKSFFKIALLLLFSSGFSIASASVSELNYTQAFNQEDLYKKYASLLAHWGCHENALGNTADSSEKISPKELLEMQASFRLACLKRLSSARAAVHGRPFYESSFNFLVTSLFFYLWWSSGQHKEPDNSMLDQFKGSFAAADAVRLQMADQSLNKVVGGANNVTTMITSSILFFRMMPLLSTVGTNLFRYFSPPKKGLELEGLEESFAENRCFIPRSLWPAINQKFMLARNNQMMQKSACNFLDFTLGLTVHKEKKLQRVEKKDALTMLHVLNKKIDAFFDDYEDGDGEHINKIKLQLRNFLFSTLHMKTKEPVPLYFVGQPGIGKTRFINNLAKSIDEALPGYTTFEDMKISSQEELEGDEDSPGMMLRILRNQCNREASGSVVFLDEANWINDSAMDAPVKRVFNGDQSSITTPYLGEDSSGNAISLERPPMLLFLAGNNQIQNKEIANRFCVVNFPKPKAATLECYAAQRMSESDMLEDCQDVSVADLQQSVRDKKLDNFRDVDQEVDLYLLSHQNGSGIDSSEPSEEKTKEEDICTVS